MRNFRLSVGPFAFLMVALIYILLGIAIPTTTAQAQKSYEFTAIAFLGDPTPGGDFFTFDFEPRGINSRRIPDFRSRNGKFWARSLRGLTLTDHQHRVLEEREAAEKIADYTKENFK